MRKVPRSATKGAGKAKGGKPTKMKTTHARKAPAAKAKPKQAAKRKAEPASPVTRPQVDDGRSREMALRAVTAALDKKALEPVLLDVRELASYTDYILIVSGRSDRQVQAIGEGVTQALALEKLRAIGREGHREGQWTLLDFGDVVVHVFYHQMRDYYDLESLWSDAPRVKLDVPPEARAQPEDFYEPSKVPG